MVYDDPTTASPDEIVNRAKSLLKIVQRNREQFLQMDKVRLLDAMKGIMEWLAAFVIRLGNDLNGTNTISKEEILKQIKAQIEEWAKMV